MKHLQGTAPVPEFSTILARPSRMIRYQDAPELVRSHLIARQGMPVPRLEMHELGAEPRTKTEPRLFDAIPDIYLHELSDALLYDGILYSGQGRFFPDSVRVFDQRDTCKFFYGPTSHLNHLGGGYFVPDDPAGSPRVVESEAVFLQCFTSHMVYGHWLLEAASNLWALPYVKALAQGAPVKLLLSPVAQVPGYMKRFGAALGITEHDYYFPSKCMRIKRIFMPTKAYMHMGYVSPFAKTIWAAIARYYKDKASIAPVEKIYLSRRQVKTRRLENEQECEALFARRGFTVVHPQQLSLPDQIRLFANATHIAGPAGSAAHNVVFSDNPGQLKTLFFAPGDYSSFKAIAVLEQAYGRRANFVIGTSRTKSKRSWRISLKELEAALDQWLSR